MKKHQEELHALCYAGLKDKGLDGDQEYVDRLRMELKELDAQGDWEYFLKTYHKFKSEKLIFPVNEYNNLIDYVLGLAPSVDIKQPSAFVQGEMPDIDIDFLREARDYIKREWAAKTFGQDKICEIGTYGTSGIKSSVLDMARIHSLPRNEIIGITTEMKDKWTDEDGNARDLEWDKALEIYPEFKKYCENNPEVAETAYALLDRNKTGGVHAGGLVISSLPIDGFVPLEVRLVNKENPNGVICAAWTEGLNRQDLGPVGLIKFDLLVINNLRQIAICCKLIKQRYPDIARLGLCALPGDWDWTDISYLNDPKSLDMANKGDLKGIFQFDSDGIRKLVKRGGVTCFDDLAAYSAIYRPATLSLGMDALYCKRKNGQEPYNIHPVLEPYLAKTYGIMIYQENVTDVLRVVGDIPDAHTEKIRKAISKKKTDVFEKYKEQFIENGQIKLNTNANYVIDLWNQIEKFSGYGFNKSHAYAYAVISARLLYLKSHYPLEFYASLMMEESKDEKLKEYKLDAKYHDVEVKSVNVNKSSINFSINEEKIYFGFSNIKGIGEGVAERIVNGQPYRNYPEFLEKFGTDTAPVRALTALGVFDDPYDRVTLRKFSEYYKEIVYSRRSRRKRFEESMENRANELRKLLLEEVKEDDPDFETMCGFTPEAVALWETRFQGITRTIPYKYKDEARTREVTYIKVLNDIAKKRANSIENFNKKEKESDEEDITISQFNPSSVDLEEEEMKLLTDELEVDGQKSYPAAEMIYYGFQWTHRLETCPDYVGSTIDNFLQSCDEGVVVGMVEVEIKFVNARTSKNGTHFWSIGIEDANGKAMVVNMWKDDWERFKDDIKEGNLVKMRVKPPSGGFNTMTFESVPRNERRKLPPKEDDYRLIVMKEPPKKEVVKQERVNLDELRFDPDAIIFQPVAKASPDGLAFLEEKPLPEIDGELDNYFKPITKEVFSELSIEEQKRLIEIENQALQEFDEMSKNMTQKDLFN